MRKRGPMVTTDVNTDSQFDKKKLIFVLFKDFGVPSSTASVIQHGTGSPNNGALAQRALLV